MGPRGSLCERSRGLLGRALRTTPTATPGQALGASVNITLGPGAAAPIASPESPSNSSNAGSIVPEGDGDGGSPDNEPTVSSDDPLGNEPAGDELPGDELPGDELPGDELPGGEAEHDSDEPSEGGEEPAEGGEDDFDAVWVGPQGEVDREDLFEDEQGYMPPDWIALPQPSLEEALEETLLRYWGNKTPTPDVLGGDGGTLEFDPSAMPWSGVIDPNPDAEGRGALRVIVYHNRPYPERDPDLVDVVDPFAPPPEIPDPVGPVADPDS